MQMTINEMIGEYGDRLGILLGKVPYKRTIGATLFALSIAGLGAYQFVRQQSADAERRLKCYADAIVKNEFQSRHYEKLYGQPVNAGLERSFLSGRPRGDPQDLRDYGALFKKMAVEGSEFRNKLTKNLEFHLLDIVGQNTYDCK